MGPSHVLTAPSRQAVVDIYNDVRHTRLIAVRICPEGCVSWVTYLTTVGEFCRCTYYGGKS